MDVFKGPVGSDQIHDYNPGIEKDGRFWTTPISRGAVEVHQGSGTARLHATDFKIAGVSFAGQQWTAATGTWGPDQTAGDQVQLSVSAAGVKS